MDRVGAVGDLIALIGHIIRKGEVAVGLTVDGDAALCICCRTGSATADPAMERALCRTTILRQFAGLTPERIPDRNHHLLALMEN